MCTGGFTCLPEKTCKPLRKEDHLRLRETSPVVGIIDNYRRRKNLRGYKPTEDYRILFDAQSVANYIDEI
jgi:hypothetical protein